MSRYPSAHGHTPSYKSVGAGAGYPSALGSTTAGSSSLTGLTSDLDREMGAMRRELDRGLGGTSLSVSLL